MTKPQDISARDRLVVATGHTVSALFLALGILAALRTHLDEIAQLAMFTVSPGIAVAWLLIGVVGVSAVVGPRAARVYLFIAGGLLLLWGLLGLLLDAAGAEMFVRDIPLVALHLIAGASSLAVCCIPARPATRRSPSDSSPERTT